jgi:hypothetical protein
LTVLSIDLVDIVAMNRPTALHLVSRRHVDLLRVCTAACPHS